jgi:tricorn protease
MRLLPILVLVLLLFTSVSAFADDTTLLLRYPDIQGERVVFVYAGDLWLADANGGDARRLTSNPGYEYLPKFSPDGRWIAFTADYDGGFDVYVVASSGGEPRRITFHPGADRVTGWTPDGRIVFRSKRASALSNYDRLFTIALGGGLPIALPPPAGGANSFSPDGTKIAYNRLATEGWFWKRYRGGTQSFISVVDFVTSKYDEVPHGAEADLFPMWSGDAIYFNSDRDGVMNLHRYDVATRAIKQLTHYRDYDIKWPSLGSDQSGRIVYEHGGALYRFDVKTERATRIAIRVPTDLPAVRETMINAQKWITTVALSPSVKRALIGARGEIFTLPAKEGETRNLTNSSGARELWPAWSPDGKWIAYASDRGGEYELYVRGQDGSGSERKLTSLGPGFRSALAWSPDSTKIAFAEASLALAYVEVAGGAVHVVDRSQHGLIDSFSWSPDGKRIAYAKKQANGLRQLFLHGDGKSVAATDGRTDDFDPQFDAEGRNLYFLSKRTFTTRFSDFERTFNFNETTGVYVMPLVEGARSPFGVREEEEETPSPGLRPPSPASGRGTSGGDRGESLLRRERSDGTGDAHRESLLPREREKVTDGRMRAVVPVPIDPGDYSHLRAAGGRLFYLEGALDDEEKTLHAFDIAERDDTTLIEDINAYAVNATGERVIYRAGQTVGIIATDAEVKKGAGKLDLARLTIRLDRRAEWKQIFDEAWRMMRDNFYDSEMRGVDWKAMKARYEAELPYVALRSDLNFLIGEMNAELGISHINASGGDTPESKPAAIGMLGCDFEVDGGRYRIARIYRGDNSRAETRAPLAEPGVDVREGDYLLAVDDRELRPPASPYSFFQEKAGRQVTLTVSSAASGAGPRTVMVVPVASEVALRYHGWVETNRRKVTEGTNGRCAYIHLPDTGDNGIAAFGRQFYDQSDKDCLLLDARFNSGGHIPDFFFERLARRHLEYGAPRHGADAEVQAPAILGPKVLVINEYAGSGGDSVADYFRKYALGPVIGKRTWGGLMGIGDELPTIDGGKVNIPNISAWDVVDGKSVWIVENHGVDPDIEVDNRPDLEMAGRDPQLERGLAILIEQLAKVPPKAKRPPYGKPPN